MSQVNEPSFADMAVSLELAVVKFGFDVARAVVIGENVGLSNMGIDVVVREMERDIKNLQHAKELLKRLAEIEPQVRTLLNRQSSGRWPMLKVVG
jgi:hypothetical protein